jgi:hypothetical protein
MGIEDRLNIFIKLNNISRLEFYKSIQVPTRYLYKDIVFSSKILVNIINTYPSLNIKWVLTGEGNMLEKDITSFLKVSCDDANCLKNYAIKLQKDKINRLEKNKFDENSFSNSYSLN